MLALLAVPTNGLAALHKPAAFRPCYPRKMIFDARWTPKACTCTRNSMAELRCRRHYSNLHKSQAQPHQSTLVHERLKSNVSLWLGLGMAAFWVLSSSGIANADEILESSSSPHYHPVAADIQTLAQNDEFWSNLARYGRYFVTVLLGTAYTAIKPIGGLLRRPVSAIIVLAVLVGLYFFVSATLSGMLGANQEPLVLFD